MIEKIKKELLRNVDKEYKKDAINFFKEPVNPIGTRLPVVRKISAKYWKEVKGLGKEKVFELCEQLLETMYEEMKTIAFDWCYRLRKEFVKNDFDIFERWLSKYCTNWANIDDFCTHSVCCILHMHPDLIPQVKNWTKSKNRWMRRASAVSFINSANKYPIENYLSNVFEIATLLKFDSDDLVQKGYGWMLKCADEFYRKEVFNYMMKNKDMPRTALRYAIEKMPKEMREQVMYG